MKEKLKKIFNKSRLTAEDKDTLRTIAAELGVEVRIDGKCANCWHDLAAELYNKVVAANGDTWLAPQYAGGIRVNGVSVFCEANMDEEKAEWLRNNGLAKYLNPNRKSNETAADEDNEA